MLQQVAAAAALRRAYGLQSTALGRRGWQCHDAKPLASSGLCAGPPGSMMTQSRAVLSKIGFQGLSVHEGTWCTDGTGLGPLLSRDSNCSDGPCRSSDPAGPQTAPSSFRVTSASFWQPIAR